MDFGSCSYFGGLKIISQKGEKRGQMAFVEAVVTSAGLVEVDKDEVEWTMQKVSSIQLLASFLSALDLSSKCLFFQESTPQGDLSSL
jgi:hypothetical protein